MDEAHRLRNVYKPGNVIGKALKEALGRAFAELKKLGASQKALIFTESRRTQDYLLALLEQSAYASQAVLFTGGNASAQAQQCVRAAGTKISVVRGCVWRQR